MKKVNDRIPKKLVPKSIGKGSRRFPGGSGKQNAPRKRGR
jgi:hypothetical protein